VIGHLLALQGKNLWVPAGALSRVHWVGPALVTSGTHLYSVCANTGVQFDAVETVSALATAAVARTATAARMVILMMRGLPGLVIGSAKEEAVMVRLVLVATSVTLTMMLFAGCGGGGDDRAKVEANVQHYLAGLPPDGNPFPIGAGMPRVRHNSCRDRHVKVEKGHLMVSRSVTSKVGIDVALWTCVVKLGTLAMPVNVVVRDGTEVVGVVPGELLREEEPNASYPSAGSPPR
jgi:hypothetical protein